MNRVTYYLHYDMDNDRNVVIKNEYFKEMLVDLMNRPCELNVILIDRFGISNSKTDDIVNEFIKDCKERDGSRYCPYPYNDGFKHFPELLTMFIGNLFRVLNSWSVAVFDVFRRQSEGYFVVTVPEGFLSKEKEDEFTALGANDLFAEFSFEDVFNYVTPSFYLWLYNTDMLYDKSDKTNLLKFKIGLH